MNRRHWVVVALASVACAPPPRSFDKLLPATMAGNWRRTWLRDAPRLLAGAVRGVEAGYQGPGKLTVDLYEMKPGLAFEAAQHWRSRPDAVCFDKDRYFVVITWEQAERDALTAFVRALEKRLAAGAG